MAPGGSLKERWLSFRNRLIADPGFQRRLASFPLTRGVSRRRTRRLFDICGGFVYSQVLHACVSLKLFDHLADNPADVETLAAETGLSEDAMARLMRAAVSLELFEGLGDGRYTLGQLGAAMAGNPAIAEMTAHHSMLYADLGEPLDLLRGRLSEPQLARYWGYAVAGDPAALSEDRIDAYTKLMSASQSFIAEDALDAYDFGRHRHLLDVGGGNGTFLTAAAARHPDLTLRLFDLPAVAEVARRRAAQNGIDDRLETVGGDFFVDSLPTGADVISLVRILHDHDDDRVLSLLRNVRQALPDDGVLVIVEPMADEAGRDPITDAYFGFYLLAMGSGRARTPREIAEFLKTAGFSTVRTHRTRRPTLTRLMTARPG